MIDSPDKVYKRSVKRYLGGRRLSLTAYLVKPFQQIRFGLYVITVFFFYLVLLAGVLVWAFRAQYLQVSEWFSVAASEMPDLLLNDVSQKAAWIVGGVLLAFIGTMLQVIIRRTHRMYGPMISIHRFVDEIKRGNYSARVRTRAADDFQDLAAHLNEMAAHLHERHGVIGCSEILSQPPESVDGPDVVSVQNPTES